MFLSKYANGLMSWLNTKLITSPLALYSTWNTLWKVVKSNIVVFYTFCLNNLKYTMPFHSIILLWISQTLSLDHIFCWTLQCTSNFFIIPMKSHYFNDTMRCRPLHNCFKFLGIHPQTIFLHHINLHIGALLWKNHISSNYTLVVFFSMPPKRASCFLHVLI